ERASNEWRQPAAVRRPGVHGRNQNQLAQMEIGAIGTLRGSHHRHGAAVRSAEQVKRRNTYCIQKLQQTMGDRAQAAVELRGAIGKSRSQLIQRVDSGTLRKRRDREPPGKGVAHKAMEQDKRRTRPGSQVAYAAAVDSYETLFSRDRRRHLK